MEDNIFLYPLGNNSEGREKINNAREKGILP